MSAASPAPESVSDRTSRADSYSVTFLPNGAAGEPVVESYPVSGWILTTNPFSRTGYAFNGWDTAADGSGTRYADEAFYTPVADLTLHAQWITYDQPAAEVPWTLGAGGTSASHALATSGIGVTVTVADGADGAVSALGYVDPQPRLFDDPDGWSRGATTAMVDRAVDPGTIALTAIFNRQEDGCPLGGPFVERQTYRCESAATLRFTFSEPVSNPRITLTGVGDGNEVFDRISMLTSPVLRLTEPAGATLTKIRSNSFYYLSESEYADVLQVTDQRTIDVAFAGASRNCSVAVPAFYGFEQVGYVGGCGTVQINGSGTTFAFTVDLRSYAVEDQLWDIDDQNAEGLNIAVAASPFLPETQSAPVIGARTASSIALTWAAASGTSVAVTDYIVQYRRTDATEWTTYTDGESVATAATVTGLTTGTSYVFRVVPVSAWGSSSPSPVSEVARTAVAPTKPALTAGRATSSTASVRFTAEAGVDYTASATIGGTQVPAHRVAVTISGASGTAVVSGLAPKQSTRITVTALRDAMEVVSDPRAVTSAAAKPAAATNVRLSLAAQKPRVRWTASARTGGAAVHYVVTVRSTRGVIVASAPRVAGTTWTGSQVLARGSYTATVVAVNEAGSAPVATSARLTVP